MELQSLGILSDPDVHDDLANYRFEMDALCGSIAKKDRERVVNYLRSGVVALAIMDYRRDVLRNRFGITDGSAIRTDGTYYWRHDTAWYVEEYGVSLPYAFLAHAEELQWQVPALTEEGILEIEAYLVLRFPSQRT